MEPIAAYEHFGLLAFFILLCGLSFIVWRWPEGKHRTFSQHVAVHKHRILYYILLFSIVLPLLLLFFIGWLVPVFHLSPWFTVFVIISSITQYACTLIPEVGGWRTRYHRALAGVSAAALLPPLLFLLGAQGVSSLARVVTVLSLGVMVAITWQIIARKGAHSHSLYLQSGYFAAFFAAILFAAYYG